MRLNLIAPPVEAGAAGNNDAARESRRTMLEKSRNLRRDSVEQGLTSDSALFGKRS